MKKAIAMGAMLAVLTVPVANASAQPSERAGCVGVFSSFFAHNGFDMHRSEVALDFAKNAQPAGLNVYSHVAEFHGSLDECFEQT